ncbi:hypothetical protein COF68_05365 [Bacillus toyonensis]|uniref:hypothetical protein n=1 Tax=Bacillus toyonensis TaxID=155322 RepID=UPI000BFB284D|nr:hypothetical protein [Bacillus toyonensis]PHE64272.1 hypothetical protein COF68_05365 [Bacillus toyonensis]
MWLFGRKKRKKDSLQQAFDRICEELDKSDKHVFFINKQVGSVESQKLWAIQDLNEKVVVKQSILSRTGQLKRLFKLTR